MRSVRRYPAKSASASAMLAAAPLSSACLTRRCSLSAAVNLVIAASQSDMQEDSARRGRHGVPAFVAEIAIDADRLRRLRRPGGIGKDERKMPGAWGHRVV